METLSDSLRAALDTAAQADAQKRTLAGHLFQQLADARAELQKALDDLGYTAEVAAVVMRSDTVFGGVRAVDEADMLLGRDFMLRAERDELVALNWQTEGWGVSGVQGLRYGSAVNALRAAIKNPATARVMVEVLRALPMQPATVKECPVREADEDDMRRFARGSR